MEAEFGKKGWKQLPDSISRKYHFVPAKVEVEEHHIGVYASKTDEHMVKADHPNVLLHGSLVSPSLAAAVINGKYVNAVPLYRLEQEFQRYGLQITRQNMANWCIRLGEEYLSVLYDYLHKELYSYHVIQADETPVLVNHDGRKAGSKSWMWVYRSGHLYQNRQIVLYEYQQTRNTSHPREFLKGYDGICEVTSHMCPARASFDIWQIVITLVSIRFQISAEPLQERCSMELCPCLCVMIKQDWRKFIFSTAEEPHPGICFRITLRLIQHLNPCFICHQISTHQ